jgi:hypothetical protein
MRIVLDVVDYRPEKGVTYEWKKGSVVDCKMQGNSITINANELGLESLANVLLALSQNAVPTGSHIHLDDLKGLEPGSLELIVVKNHLE